MGREPRVELLGVRPRGLALRRLGATIASRLAVTGLVGPALRALSLHERGGILGRLARGEISFLPGVWVVIVLLLEAAEVPAFAFSFDGGRNRIRWVVELTADVAAWADVDEELEIDIAP